MAGRLDTNEDVIDRADGKAGNPYDFEYINALRAVSGVTISCEVFEKLYETDQAAAELWAVMRSIFGKPMPT